MTTPKTAAKQPEPKSYRATADVVLPDGTMTANTIASLDPADKNVAAFVRAGKLVEVEPPKAKPE